jgi:hypothetical protein
MEPNYLIKEIHTFRQKQAEAFSNDLEAICHSAIDRQKKSGHKVAVLSPKLIRPILPSNAAR